MKGKGKAPHDKDKDKEKDRDIKDCSLQFPDFNTVEHPKECGKYTQVLTRVDASTVSLEELDNIQADIEILLASVGKRLKILETENQVLISWPDKKDVKKNGKGSDNAIHTPSSGGKRKGTPTSEEKEREKTSKKFKDANGKASQSSTPTPRSKGKNSQSKTQPEEAAAASSAGDVNGIDLPKLPKNDAVNRFWTAVEPYCSPISADDLRVIEDLLKSYEEDTEYMKIPALGIHYTQRWAEEDLLEEQADGAKIDKKKSSEHCNGGTNVESLKKRELRRSSSVYMDDSPFGPLTQRLVSALIEDNLMTPMDDSMADIADNGTEPMAVSPTSLAKQMNIGNPATLERRIRKELEDQGILEKEEDEDDPSDEVLAELRRKQQELRAISQQNINILKSLYRQGQEDMARHESRKKLMAIDSEVMDAYRKIQIAKQKKKSPSKKEKEAMAKALKEREALMKLLET